MNTPDLKSLLETESNNWSSTTSFSFPGEESFTDKTERWTTYAPPTYSAAISPATEEDVAKAVRRCYDKGTGDWKSWLTHTYPPFRLP